MSEFEVTLTDAAKLALAHAVNDLATVTSVANDANARTASEFVSAGKNIVKSVHDQRMAVTRQIDAAKKKCMAREAEICADLNAEIERVSKMCSAYFAQKAAAQAAARAAEEERMALARAAAAAESALTGVAVEAPPETVAKSGKPVEGVSSRTIWTFDVVDANAVPRAYCVPDSALIRAYMTEAKKSGAKIEDLAVPGVVFRAEIRI